MKNRVGEPFIITAPYEGENPELKYSTHSGQEFILILEGSLLVVLKDKEEVLNAGDTIYFDGRSQHALTARNGKSCKFLSIVMHTNTDDSAPESFAVQKSPAAAPVCENRTLLYQKYMTETWGEDGSLKKVDFQIPENFNFAFDVLDYLAEREPEKLAMRWVSNQKE